MLWNHLLVGQLWELAWCISNEGLGLCRGVTFSWDELSNLSRANTTSASLSPIKPGWLGAALVHSKQNLASVLETSFLREVPRRVSSPHTTKNLRSSFELKIGQGTPKTLAKQIFCVTISFCPYKKIAINTKSVKYV